MVSSSGQGDTVHGKQPKHPLSSILKTSYQDIQDEYDRNPKNPKIIQIDEKNDYHFDGVDAGEKSVISPTYCPYKLCKAMLTEFSRLAVITVEDKKGNKQVRLLVTGTFN